jgi:hypothetical protein
MQTRSIVNNVRIEKRESRVVYYYTTTLLDKQLLLDVPAATVEAVSFQKVS